MKRTASQIIGTVLHNSYFNTFRTADIYQGFLKGICPPTLNCYACPLAVVSCPIGALQHFAVIRVWPYYVGGFLATMGLALGKLPCGWVCPFGFFQDLLAKLSRKKLKFPRRLTYGPYVTLAVLVVALPLLTAEPWFSKLCPAGTLEASLPWVLYVPSKYAEAAGLVPREMIGVLFWIKLGIFAAIVILCVFITRAFCLFFCPMGAILGVFNRISLVKLEVSEESCGQCEDTTITCPVYIDVRETPNHRDCYRCLICAKGCDHIRLVVTPHGRSKPVPEAQAVGFGGGTPAR